MKIERTNNEILIRVAKSTDLTGLQRLLDFIKFREIASRSKASQKKIEGLSRESKRDWWAENKSDFLK